MHGPREHEVHVWCAGLDVSADTVGRLYATLSSTERERHSRFRFRRDQQRFVAAHGALRDILGRYLGVPPDQVRYVCNPSGKPELDPVLRSGLRFNLSHSSDLALVAVATHARVGVDVEAIREESGYAEIAQHFFSPLEVRRLHGLSKPLYAEAFLGHWTRKEACLKALGEGLATSQERGSLASALRPRRRAAVLGQVPDGCMANGNWSVHALRPAPGYIGALAIEGHGWHVHEYPWGG